VSGGVIAVVAHPDDESLIAGGTLALAASAGAQTAVVSLTRGEQGPRADNANTVGERLGDVRERELEAAARELGVEWARCLALPDGELPWVDQDEAARELAAVLEPCAPAAVLTFGEDGLYWHSDHIATRRIARAAVERLEGEVEVYEAVWAPETIPALAAAATARGLPSGLWGLDPASFGWKRDAQCVLDVRPVLTRKLAALRAHRSQIGPDHLFWSLPVGLAERFLGFERWAGPSDGRLAELLANG
jgi:LmbE family N-acetylglucosaminyl deacetylase